MRGREGGVREGRGVREGIEGEGGSSGDYNFSEVI